MPAKPRFTDIAAHLREAIRSGHFAVGSTLPTELALGTHYQTSRHTVRAALQELQQAGLVSRRKNAGTRVESATPVAGFRHALASMEDLAQFGAAHTRVVQQVEPVACSAALAKLLLCEAGTHWLRIASLRLDGPPGTGASPASQLIGWTEVYVVPGHEGLEAMVRAYPDVLVSTLLETHFGQNIQAVTQDVCAVTLPVAAARSLQVEQGTPGLRIIRRYLNQDGKLVEASVTHHPAERFSLHTRLTRATPR